MSRAAPHFLFLFAFAALPTLLFAKPEPATAPVSAKPTGQRTLNFERDITPLFSRFGCNASSCHGKAEGQNGFKLSVFGYDPVADHSALAYESRGRRISASAPDVSLLLRKISGEIPHAGGARILRGTSAYETMRTWVSTGAPFGSTNDARVASIQIEPAEQVVAANSQLPLRVIASFTDGTKENVTHLCIFQSNNESLARVDARGVISTGNLAGQSAVMARYLGSVAASRILIPRSGTTAAATAVPTFNFIDTLVDQQLRKLNLAPSGLCDDATFLRRAYFDVIGTAPTATETRAFLADTRPDRRARLVDALLARPEYADYWALRWADLLRVDRQALGHKGAFAYYQWIRGALLENQPFNRIARDLLTAEGPLDEAAAGHFYKVNKRPGDMSGMVAQVFLGIRIACAECHQHPYDRWSQRDYYGMQSFFQQVSYKKGANSELLTAEGSPTISHPRTREPIHPYPLGGVMPATTPEGDRRQQLATWLAAPENPWFARNLANRMVSHFFGRGLVEPVDDVRATNPASNPPLLDALERHVVETRFDLKQLIRTLTASRTYQLSATPNAANEQDEQNYSRALLRRLPSEVLLDAVSQATGVPEKFEGVPAGQRAIQLWDSQVDHYFLKIFGRPQRASACECERNSGPSISQVLHLMNSPELQGKLAHEGGTVARLVREHRADEPLVEELYLTFFSRFPTSTEKTAALRHLERGVSQRRQAAEDLVWGLLNSLEFVHNH